ncbi:MAG: M23 family metallopeptidase [Ilumatobacteraceae bacterium]
MRSSDRPTIRRVIATVAVSFATGAALLTTSTPAAAGRLEAKTSCAIPYSVVAGDSWSRIAQKSAVSLSKLYAANAASAATPLYPGGTVCLPANATTTTAPVATTPATTAPTTPPTSGGDAPAVTLAAFPVQGPCWFTDSWLANRGGGRKHEGVDLIAKSGQYLYAVVDGTLTRQVFDRPGSRSGNAWWLTAGDGSKTYYFYAHLSAFAPGLSVGSTVVAGQIIGYVGRTGNAGGPHLHFEIHPGGGAAVNPTASVKAIDGCRTTTVPPQPGGVVPEAPTSTAPPAGPTTTVAPPTTVVSSPPAIKAGITNPNTGRSWQFISPSKAFDGNLSANQAKVVKVGGLSGVAASTNGVLLRLTASGGGGGYVTAYPCDAPPPATTSLSFDAGRTAIGTALVEVVGGVVCVQSSASVSLKVEVLASRVSKGGVGLVPVTPNRVLDTRQSGRLAANGSISLSPAQLGASGAQALTVSVTILNPSAAGTFSLGFCGQGPWKLPTSADAFTSFTITMRTSASGWCLSSTVDTDVIIDVVGVWTGATSAVAVRPQRIFDSRNSGAVNPNWVFLGVAGTGGVPAGASSVVVSVTGVAGGNASTIYLLPCGQAMGSGATLAVGANQTRTAMATVGLGNGQLCVSATAPIHVLIDVVGAG